MPSIKNVQQLELLKQKKTEAKSVVFAHYRGLGVNDVSQLRSQIKDAGGEMLVTKNTLLRLAFADKELDKALVGPTAAIFAYEDEIEPLKIVSEFSKKHQLPTLTAGFFDDKVLDLDQVQQLSKLPGKKELQAQLVGTIAAPISGFLNVLQGNTRNLIYALKAVADQKSAQ